MRGKLEDAALAAAAVALLLPVWALEILIGRMWRD